MKVSDCLEIALFFLKRKGRAWGILSFLILFLFYHAHATTPQCPIITGGFQGLPNGTTVNTSATGWSLDASGLPPSAVYFAVRSNRIHAEALGGIGIWRSNVFSVAGYSSFQVAVKVSSEGNQNNTEYAQVYYRVNGGSEILLAERRGNFGTIDFISPELTGNNVQIIVKLYNYNNGAPQRSKYYIEEYRVFKEQGPCSSGSITVSATTNRTQLTCSNASATLSASTTASGVSYRWTGPNGFTSTSQNPVVSAAGTYTVTGTNSTGSGSASVTITENKTPPGVTATGGSLSCAAAVTLTASSSTSGVSYSWSGPNNYSSSMQNPAVNVAGTYTVTVTNPANGCTSQQSVSVTTGATTIFWHEDFTLPNGTTQDTGPTSWSSQNTSSGTFSVQSNEFRVSGIGNSTQGVWTSGVIDITGKANVTVSVDTRSSGSSLNNSGTNLDYLRIYYKLNGSSTEVLFSEQVGSINNSSTTPTTVSIGSLSGNSIQIIIKARATATDEFYYFDNVRVSGSTLSSSFTVAIPTPGVLTCTTPSVTLTANGSVSGLSYSWTGPNGFSSVQQNPVVNAAGQYTVTASQGGCAAVTSVTVTENKTVPQLTASGGTLTCAANVTLSASSTVSGVTYRWTGPGGFTSTQQNPAVSTPGTYAITATNPANGCTNTQSVTVNTSTGSDTASDFWLEDFTLPNGTTSRTGNVSWSIQNPMGTFSVQSNEFKASFPSANEGVWLSGVVDISTKSDVVISALLKSGTSSSNDYLENDDYIKVYYKLNGGPETLVYQNFGGLNGNHNSLQSYTATSAPLNGNTVQVVIRVRNSHTTEQYYFDNVKLNGKNSPLVVTASANGSISCTNTTVQLLASSSVSTASYYWIRPDGNTINQQNPSVSEPGNYTVVVTANGCSATRTVTVTGDRTLPDVNIAGENFSCSGNTSAVTLRANSSIEGLAYSWTSVGAGTITNPTSATVSVSAPGSYIVQVTNPANACSSTAVFHVGYSDGSTTAVWNETFDDLPDGTTSDNGATAWSVDNSKIHTVNLSAYSDESGIPYYHEVRNGRLTAKTTRGEVVWISQPIGITAHGQVQLAVDVTGEGSLNDETDCGSNCFDYDYVKISYRLNGGPEIPFTNYGSFPGKLALNGLTAFSGLLIGNTIQIVIRSYNTGNNEIFYFDNIRVLKVETGTATLTASASGVLTCANNTVTLSATPAVPGVTYSWVGPGNVTYTGASVHVNEAGTYNLTVSGSGGCLSGATATVTVLEDKASPVVTVSTPDVLTCNLTSLNLVAVSSPASGMNYRWTRPDGSSLLSAALTVTTPGAYHVKVTDPVNGCFGETTVNVYQNITPPDVTVTSGGSLTCAVNSVNLVASSITEGVRYAWTGPEITTDPTLATITVTAEGIYTVTVTNPSTGCITTRSITVTRNNTPPVIEASVSGPLTCTTTTVTLTATSNSPSVTYIWGGPGPITNPTSATATVTTAGTYLLIGTDVVTGCVSIIPVDVIQQNVLPGVTASASGMLTCTSTTVNLVGTSETPGVTYLWSGPGTITNPTSATATVTTEGTYLLTVTLASTGCVSTASVNVIANTARPTVTASVSGVFTCAVTSVTLTANAATSGVTYQWSGPGNFSSSLRNPVINVSGTYAVTVTDPVNGCTSDPSTVTTQESKTLPGVTLAPVTTITCGVPVVTLSATSPTAGVSYQWSGPNGFGSSEQQPGTSIPGSYTVTVTNPVNGCISTASTTVEENRAVPSNVTATIASPGVLTCTTTTVTLNGSSSTLGVTYAWAGPYGFAGSTQNITTTVPGIYILTVTNPVNGCTASAQVTVTQQIERPEGITAVASNVLTCTTTSATITGTSITSGVTYSWTGPGSFTSSSPSFSTSVAGTYTLTVMNPVSGCSSTPVSVVLTEDKAAPAISVSAPDGTLLTCFVSPVRLNGNSSTSGATFRWTSPTGFEATTPEISVTVPGDYTLTVTGANGCQVSTTRRITQTLTNPVASASVSGIISCSTPSVTLTGGSSGTPVTYQWSGPSGFTASQKDVANITIPGVYSLTIVTPGNCTDTKSVTVEKNITVPADVTAEFSGSLDCDGIVILQANSSTPGAIYKWTGPDGFETTEQEAVTTLPGRYILTVTHPVSGCVITREIIIEEGTC